MANLNNSLTVAIGYTWALAPFIVAIGSGATIVLIPNALPAGTRALGMPTLNITSIFAT